MEVAMNVHEREMEKKRMVSQVWNKKQDYYDKTQGGNEALLKGPHYQRVLPYLQQSGTILEVGCGDGGALKTLATVLPKKTRLFGVDISSLAIRLAKKNFPSGEFKVADGDTLPYKDNTFDCTCSFFTFEHVIDPQEILMEMTRVTKPGGFIIIICPNYGSPIYRSPCATDSVFSRLWHSIFSRNERIYSPQFGWKHVKPIADRSDFHVPDHDTLIEPDLSLFVDVIESRAFPKLSLVDATSLWETITPQSSIKYYLASLPFRIAAHVFGRPFLYWGQLFVATLKKSPARKKV